MRITADERRALVGSIEQVRDDIAGLAAHGVDEVFVDLNFDPAVASPDADPAASMAYAREVIHGLAPRS